MRAFHMLILGLLLTAPALAHDRYRSCRGHGHHGDRGYARYGGYGYRPYGHKHYGYARYSYRAHRPNVSQRYRYWNRYYTGRSYLDHRLYGYGYGRYGHARYVCADYGYYPRYPYGRYTRPYAALAPIYSRYGASLTLYDPIFERDTKGGRDATRNAKAGKGVGESDGDGLPQARERRVGARFLSKR